MAKVKVKVKAKKKVNENPFQPTEVTKEMGKGALEAMAPKREPSSVVGTATRSKSNPVSKTVKVKANKQLKSAPSKAAPVMKTKDSVANPMESAKSGPNPMGPTANRETFDSAIGSVSPTYAPNPNLSALGGVTSVTEQNEFLDQVTDKGEVYNARIQAEAKKAKPKVKAAKPKPKVKAAKPEEDKTPPGTFRNVDGDLVLGDRKKFQGS